ncbi:ACT domain-containing protein [Acidaminobacterium chupaoyuni]
MAEQNKYLLIDSRVLPDVFLKVVEAKKMLAKGKVKSATMAARACGISRSAFYKYKDSVEEYDLEMRGSMVTLYFSLEDQPGILSAVLSCIYSAGANVITINQNVPTDGVAPVTISIKLNQQITLAQLQISLLGIDGVIKVKEI